jgi:hypothetical protein
MMNARFIAPKKTATIIKVTPRRSSVPESAMMTMMIAASRIIRRRLSRNTNRLSVANSLAMSRLRAKRNRVTNLRRDAKSLETTRRQNRARNRPRRLQEKKRQNRHRRRQRKTVAADKVKKAGLTPAFFI